MVFLRIFVDLLDLPPKLAIELHWKARFVLVRHASHWPER